MYNLDDSSCFTANEICYIKSMLYHKKSYNLKLLHRFLKVFGSKIEQNLENIEKGGLFSSLNFLFKYLEKIKYLRNASYFAVGVGSIVSGIVIVVCFATTAAAPPLSVIAALFAFVGGLTYIGFTSRKILKRRSICTEDNAVLDEIFIKQENDKYEIKKFDFLSVDEKYSSTTYLNLYDKVSQIPTKSDSKYACNFKSLRSNDLDAINYVNLDYLNNISHNRSRINQMKKTKVSKIFGVKKRKRKFDLLVTKF